MIEITLVDKWLRVVVVVETFVQQSEDMKYFVRESHTKIAVLQTASQI